MKTKTTLSYVMPNLPAPKHRWFRHLLISAHKGMLTFVSMTVMMCCNSFSQTIAGGGNHSLALCNDSNVPVQVSALSGIAAIAGGANHSLALKNDGTVRAWGENYVGQLGNGNLNDSNVPVQVSSLSGITAIAGGAGHSLALRNDGTVWAWGSNFQGQLGNVTSTGSNVPVQVTGLCQNLTGVEEENIISTINIFPNPATNEFKVESRVLGTKLKVEAVEVYDVVGGKVKDLTPALSKGEGVRVDVSSLAQGIYFVRVRTEKGSVVKKLIKQ